MTYPTLAERLIEAIYKYDFGAINHYIDCLPHGSGINDRWDYDGSYVMNTFSIMDEYGYYRVHVDFKVNLKTSKVTFQTTRKGYYWIQKTGLKEYLSELFAYEFDRCDFEEYKEDWL